jgi:NADH-quinone oxidoreductase subunit J
MIETVFYGSGTVAVLATLATVVSRNPVHALLYLIVSLLAVALMFFVLGAPFAALLEVIVYAGAIMVLFVFVVMMLNLGDTAVEQEQRLLAPRIWVGPVALASVLLIELLVLLSTGPLNPTGAEVTAKQVGIALYGPYLLAVELASMLLLAGLVAAYHLGRNE